MGISLKENLFTFGNKSTKDFGIVLSGFDTYSTPERDVTMMSVPGRSGDLTLDNGRFENVELTYKCLIYKNNLRDYEAFRSFMASCRGYQRLEDNFHPEEYRVAVFKDDISPKLKGDYEAASFEITFNCKPQRYLKSGEESITIENGGIIVNPTLFESKPLIRAYANGNLVVNGKTFTITNIDEYIDIDCDIMNAYKGSTNMNNNVSGIFPYFITGENVIQYTGRLDIVPRWYTL